MNHNKLEMRYTGSLPCPCNCYMYWDNFLCHRHSWWAPHYFESICPYENYQFLKETNNINEIFIFQSFFPKKIPLCWHVGYVMDSRAFINSQIEFGYIVCGTWKKLHVYQTIWNIEQWTSRIIPIEDVEQANMLLLWDIYGNCVPIAFPYNGYHQHFFPYIFHTLKCGKTEPHICSISSPNLPIPFPDMGHIWPMFCHIIPILLFW